MTQKTIDAAKALIEVQQVISKNLADMYDQDSYIAKQKSDLLISFLNEVISDNQPAPAPAPAEAVTPAPAATVTPAAAV